LPRRNDGTAKLLIISRPGSPGGSFFKTKDAERQRGRHTGGDGPLAAQRTAGKTRGLAPQNSKKRLRLK